MQKDFPRKILQTQALVNESFISLLPSRGYSLVQTIQITDEYFVGSLDVDFPIHTFEKSGVFIRVRNGIQEVHRSVSSPEINLHRIREVNINDGTINVLESNGILGKAFNIESISKKREVWTNNQNELIVDYYDQAIIVEIQTQLQDSDDISKAVSSQVAILHSIGIEDSQIISDSYIYRKIHFKIKNSPDIKLRLLEEELVELTSKLREKEMMSGEAFTDTGDGWHENPTYETIYHEMLTLNNMIINVREEIIKLKSEALS